MRRLIWRQAQGEQGSILIGAIMLTLVLTLLGFALFDLAVIESRLALGTEADYRAFEIAQAGIERMLHQLFLDLCGGSVSCLSPPASPSWADGTINGTAFTTTTSSFACFFPTVVSGPCASNEGAFSGSFGGETYAGRYSVELKHLTNAEAQGIGLACSGDPCTDAIYVRARGNFASGVGTSATRTIQVVATNLYNGLGDGIVAGSPAAGSITGNVEIHGSLHVVACGSKPACNQLVFSGGAGIRNNYNGMPTALQDLIPLLPQVTCPAGTACAGTLVETLGAKARMAYPQPGPLIDIQSNAITVGESGGGSSNAYTGVVGKPTMDGVFLGTGCAAGVSPLCADAVGSRPENVYSDAPIKAYDQSPEPTYPLLDDPVTIFPGQDYDDFAACSGPGACNTSGAVVSGSGNDFFISHAAKILSTTTEDSWACESGACTRNLLNLLSGQGGLAWDDTTVGWSKTFSCSAGGSPVSCTDAGGNRVTASVNGSTPAGFQIEWDRGISPGTGTFSVFQCPSPDSSVNCMAPSTAAASGSGLTNNAAYRWKVAFVDGLGAVSVPSGGSNFYTATNPAGPTDFRAATVTISAAPAGTASCRIYRNKSGSTRDYYLVNTVSPCSSGTTYTDSASDGSLGAAAPTGLLSDPTNPVLPALIYVDDRLKICENCNNKTFYFRGSAAFVVKGNSTDITSDTASIALDPDWLACPGTPCPPAVADHATFPQQSVIWFYTPGNIFMGLQSQRNMMGYWYAGNKWKTTKQTNVVGGVTSRIFDITSQVPSFWEVKTPRTTTAFPPRGQRFTVSTVRWKECVGTVPAGAC